jgi:transcriptional regulator with GAF, ATPase, and Fis domain
MVVLAHCGPLNSPQDEEAPGRARSLLDAERRTLEMISRGATLASILEDICRSVEAHAPEVIASVLLADQDGHLLWPVSGPRMPSALASKLSPLAIGPNIGSADAAALRRELVIVSDIATDPLFSGTRAVEYRDIALRHGLRAVWSQPLLSRTQEVVGAFAMYCAEPRAPTEGELELINGAKHVALVAIEGARAQSQTGQAQHRGADDTQLEDRVRNENQALREEIDRSSMFEQIVGSSRALRRVLAQVKRVAEADSTVLITGETGTGKELVARAIHKNSKRSGRAFIRVNCASVPPSLIASELFGHEKGAFTGALQRRLGRFELANGGTLFLDEVGELTVETQLALLRVLQEREFERVGASQPIRVDVRVLAATNRDLMAAMAAGEFRQDLYYRLNVFPIHVPSLRERADDIPLLVEYLVARYASMAGKRIRNIETKTLDLFQRYDWPGNIRELQNVIERAVILSDGDVFSIDESWVKSDASLCPRSEGSLYGSLAQRERAMIEAALSECQGRVSGPTGAATRLGVPRQTLESRIRALRINKNKFKAF